MRVELLSYLDSGRLLEKLGGGASPDPELLPHLSFTFAVEGVSRACSHQLVRHRTASFSQQSQRYLKSDRLAEHVVIPETLGDEARALFMELVEAAGSTYNRLVEAGVPREDARFVLPNAAETNLLATMDGRALNHFFGLRCCFRAQWEIRALADSMLAQVRAVEPLFDASGPYCCQLGYCPEGRFYCGRMDEAVRRYRKLEASA